MTGRFLPVGADETWDGFLERFPEATFYHTRRWARIVERAFPGLEDLSCWIDREDGRAVLPLFGWRRLGGAVTTLQSSFPFLYGGPVPRWIGSQDLLPEVLTALARGGRSLLLVSNPFATGGDSSPSPAPPHISVERDSTHLLSLPARYEEFWEGILTTAKRNDVRRLAKKGVTIRLGGKPEEAAAVYRFYRQSFTRWGGRPGFVYPEALYQAMLAVGGEAIRLYLAECEGRIIGGSFVVRWNGRVHYHAGYFDHDSRALRPNVLLQDRIIRDAIEDGLRQYDFLPSGGNEGVEAFKEGFGGSRTLLERYQYTAPLHRLLRFLRRG